MWLGIDFGTCNSSAALLLDGTLKRIAEPLKHDYCFPSSIFVTGQGEILVGHAAENARQQDPQRYCHEFKRDLGSDTPYTLGNRQMLPEELITEVIRKLKVEADKVVKGRGIQPLSDAIITVPATYGKYKRDMMQEAGMAAGFSQVELLDEPVAAAIYYSRHAPVVEGEIVLVYDLGGGTFDATLVQRKAAGYKILAMPKGLPNCGGKDFDREIYQDFKQRCSESLGRRLDDKKEWRTKAIVGDLCKQIKHQLSEAEEAQVYIPIGDGESYTLTRQVFNGIIEPLIGETIDCCDQLVRSAGIEWQQVDRVLLVGGSCRIPYVQETVEEKFGRPHLLVDEPELAVCLGAAIHREEFATQEKPSVHVPQSLTEPVPIPPLSREEVEAYLKRGEEKSQAGDYVGAIADYDEAIRLNLNDAEFYCNRGNAYDSQRDYQRAIADYDEAIRLNPNEAALYSNRGNAYDSQGDYQRAIADLDEAIRLNPNEANFYCNRGSAYNGQRDYQRAITDLDEAIRLNPNYADFYCNRGNAYSNQGDYQRAIADYDHVLKIDPNFSEANTIRTQIEVICSQQSQLKGQKDAPIYQPDHTFYNHLAKCLSEQGYDVNLDFENKQMNEILGDIKNLKGISLIAQKAICVVAAIQAEKEEERIDRIFIANSFHQYQLKKGMEIGILLFVFSESKFVSEFIEKEQNNCKLNEFWKLTYTISWVVDLEKKEVHGHSGLPILMGTYLDRDRLTQSLFFNRLEYLEKIKAY
jgi:tetratricopeptide (TPR) repeat protein/actin-like ATPase involved in cell morphogenesis